MSDECEREQGRLLFLIRCGPNDKGGITTLGWEYYSKHPNKYVRVAVASRMDCPCEIRERLAHDDEPAVVAAVMANRSTRAGLKHHIAKCAVRSYNRKESVVWHELLRCGDLPKWRKLQLQLLERKRLGKRWGWLCNLFTSEKK